jgi:hypothetical protein
MNRSLSLRRLTLAIFTLAALATLLHTVGAPLTEGS